MPGIEKRYFLRPETTLARRGAVGQSRFGSLRVLYSPAHLAAAFRVRDPTGLFSQNSPCNLSVNT